MTPDLATTPAPPPGRNAGRLSLVLAACEVLAAVLLVWHFHWQAERSVYKETMISYELSPWMPPMEASFTLFFTLSTLPAVALLADALRRAFQFATPRWSVPVPAQAVVLVALLAAGGSLVIRRSVLLEADFTDDERLYWYEAQALLEGRFTGDKPEPYDAFPHTFTVTTPDGARMAGVYPVGVPVTLAAEAALRLPHIFQTGFVFLAVLAAAALARRLLGSDRAALAAALLCGSSPTLILLGATRHNTVGATAALCLTVLACTRVLEQLTLRRAAAAGAAAGLTFLMRPDDGMLAVLLVAGAVSVAAWPRRREPGPVVAAAAVSGAAFLAVAAVQFLAFRETTGSWLQSPYQYWVNQRYGGVKLLGFGKSIWGVEQTVPSAFTKLLTALARLNLWVQGWACSLALPAVALALPSVRRRVRVVLVAAAMVFTLCFLFMTPAVNDFGSNYHLPAVPLLAVLGAGVLQYLWRRASPAAVGATVIAATVVGLATFWPLQLLRLNLVAQTSAAPVEAAAAVEGEKLLVLWRTMQAPGTRSSWVFFPPLPAPSPGTERVVWFRDDPRLYPEARARFADRTVYRLAFEGPRRARLVPATLDPPAQPEPLAPGGTADPLQPAPRHPP